MLFLFAKKVYNVCGDFMHGFLLIDKPIGMTSHDVVYKVKRKLQVDKIGHTGTLDPFASGLLILCVGKATKLQSLFLNLDKVYEGTILLGKHYDTYDCTGKVVEQKEVKLDDNQLADAIKRMNKTYDQTPPMYSAVKVQGRKLYDLARQGQTVDVEPRLVSIYDFHMTSTLKGDSFDFYAYVSKGTYLRSLAVDLATSLGTHGALSHLRRLSIGSYHVDSAKRIEEISSLDLISLESFFSNIPSITLSDYMCKLVKNGVYLDERQIITKEPFIVKDNQGKYVAYYEVVKENTYRPVIIF